MLGWLLAGAPLGWAVQMKAGGWAAGCCGQLSSCKIVARADLQICTPPRPPVPQQHNGHCCQTSTLGEFNEFTLAEGICSLHKSTL